VNTADAVDEPVAEDQLPHGVGPWDGPWPDDPRYDPELLANGDRRNVVDEYRYWRREAIVADLDHRRHGFHVAIENWQHDFNIGSVVRTANAFLAAEVHIVGRRRWNRRRPPRSAPQIFVVSASRPASVAISAALPRFFSLKCPGRANYHWHFMRISPILCF
jgi:hypothetical protein